MTPVPHSLLLQSGLSSGSPPPGTTGSPSHADTPEPEPPPKPTHQPPHAPPHHDAHPDQPQSQTQNTPPTSGASTTRPHRPRRRRKSPATQSAPARAEVPTMSGALAQAAPLAASPATGTPAFPTIADRPSAQTSGPAPQVRGRWSRRTGPSPMLAVGLRV